MANTVVAMLGLPFDEHSSYLRGAAQGPARLREAFRCESSNSWAERGVDVGGVEDAGDAASWDGIEAAVGRLLDRGRKPLLLGGDHSVTYPVLKAFRTRKPGLAVLHFDAHPDIYPEFQGNRLSHACPFARIMEEGLAARLVQVGIRCATGVQRGQIRRFGVEVVEMKDFRGGWAPAFDGPVYVSFDLDALDPAHAPGVSHPEPGGLTTRQAIDVLHRLRAPEVAGADVVEYNPTRDANGMTGMVGARLMKELAAAMLSGPL